MIIVSRPSGVSQGVVGVFEKQLVAGWGDMDFNSHMRNTSFLDKSADIRMMFFSENGFPMEEFIRRKIGPVIRKEEIEYFKVVTLLYKVTIRSWNRLADTFKMEGNQWTERRSARLQY